jgi:predicted flap endonuclease-1-like 5' DNA nuclease
MARAGTRPGSGLVALGLLAVLRAWTAAAPPVQVEDVGEPVPLEVESLAGDAFRLLPGVGPVLAERLEAARLAAGGRLDERSLAAIPGIGPSLRARWRVLRTR